MTKPVQSTAQRLGFRLGRWHRRSIYVACVALLASGLAWLLVHFFMRPASRFGEAVHPLEPWTMKIHGAAAMAALVLAGSLFHVHIRRAIKAGRNLVPGWTVLAAFVVLVVTGYGLYYLTDETDRPVWSALHWIVGLAAAVVFPAHILNGRNDNA